MNSFRLPHFYRTQPCRIWLQLETKKKGGGEERQERKRKDRKNERKERKEKRKERKMKEREKGKEERRREEEKDLGSFSKKNLTRFNSDDILYCKSTYFIKFFSFFPNSYPKQKETKRKKMRKKYSIPFQFHVYYKATSKNCNSIRGI